MRPQHKPNRYRFSVLEAGGEDKQIRDMICHNCKERHYLIERKTDRANLFCMKCGALTPIRSIRRERGLAAPSIQAEQTAIIQPKLASNAITRRPRSMTEKRTDPVVQTLEAKGFQIIDSQYIEPEAQQEPY